MDLGRALRFYRALKDITQVELADKAGIARSYIHLLERNKRLPRINILSYVCEVLDIKMSELFLQAESYAVLKKEK